MEKQLLNLGFTETSKGQFLLKFSSVSKRSGRLANMRAEFERDDDGVWSGIISSSDGYDFEEKWDGSTHIGEWLAKMEEKYWDC